MMIHVSLATIYRLIITSVIVKMMVTVKLGLLCLITLGSMIINMVFVLSISLFHCVTHKWALCLKSESTTHCYSIYLIIQSLLILNPMNMHLLLKLNAIGITGSLLTGFISWSFVISAIYACINDSHEAISHSELSVYAK